MSSTWLTGGELEEAMGLRLPEGTVFAPDATTRHGSTGLGLIGAWRGVHSLLSRRPMRLFVVRGCLARSSCITLRP